MPLARKLAQAWLLQLLLLQLQGWQQDHGSRQPEGPASCNASSAYTWANTSPLPCHRALWPVRSSNAAVLLLVNTKRCLRSPPAAAAPLSAAPLPAGAMLSPSPPTKYSPVTASAAAAALLSPAARGEPGAAGLAVASRSTGSGWLTRDLSAKPAAQGRQDGPQAVPHQR